MLLVESECVPVLGELVEPLDQFCRLAPGAQKEDEEDLAWAGVRSESWSHISVSLAGFLHASFSRPPPL